MLPALLLMTLCLGAVFVRAGIDPKLGYITADDSEFEGHEGDFFKFVSRPDIQAPRWQVHIHEPANVSKGYWFVAPYEHTFRPAPLPAWVGPHIYDSEGGLIWSGASMFQGSDSYDFRLSDVDDEKLMTFAYRDDCAAVFMDRNYKVQKEGRFARNLGDLNMHDLNVIENGSRALVLTKQPGVATDKMSKDVGLQHDVCHVGFDGFKLMDTSKDEWEPVFEWSTFDHIPLTESTYVDRDIEERCSRGWDYLHLNSVDKCADGNYLLSARHSNTIYKIDGNNGAIMWRLGGKQSDFEQDFNFSRQHDIRCREQEGGKHTISFLDNAKGHDSNDATNAYSRGLIVEVDTDASPKTAWIQHEYAHPSKNYSTSRGNLEIMDNGNIFMGWSSRCLQSEYTPDGQLVMEAKLVPEFLGTYRAYKFPFHGHPTSPPDVHSEVFENRGGNGAAADGKLTTHVYVSWNGATNVDEWRLYKSDSSAANKELIATAKRSGFETLLLADGEVSYVVVEAVDSWGHEMKHGRSGVVMTVHPADWVTTEDPEGTSRPDVQADSTVKDSSPTPSPAPAVAPVPVPAAKQPPPPPVVVAKTNRTLPILTFLAGFASMGVLLAMAWLVSRLLKDKKFLARFRPARGPVHYLPLAESEKEADAKDPVPTTVLRTRERSESKLETATSIAPSPMKNTKSLHRRGDSIQRVGRVMPPTP